VENPKKNIIGIIDEGILYIHDGTSNKLFYYALKPIGKIKGLRKSDGRNRERC
jgi:hypothetical protein